MASRIGAWTPVSPVTYQRCGREAGREFAGDAGLAVLAGEAGGLAYHAGRCGAAADGAGRTSYGRCGKPGLVVGAVASRVGCDVLSQRSRELTAADEGYR